jgi:hypothetical protein
VDLDPSPDGPFFDGWPGVILGMVCGFAGPLVVAVALLVCGLSATAGFAVGLAGAVVGAVAAYGFDEATLAAGIMAGLALSAIVFGGCSLMVQSMF